MDKRFMLIPAFLLLVLAGYISQAGTAGNGQNGANMTTTLNGTGNREIVVFETTMGNIEVELDRQHAPLTVENFVSYVKAGHYDGTVFHRVIKGFMVQGGGFTSEGAEKSVNAPIKLESNNGLKNNAGTIAMARTNDPNSATAQFFINTVDNPFLDYSPKNPGYAVFGKVVSGMDVVKKIEGTPTASRTFYDDWPVQDVVISRAYMKS